MGELIVKKGVIYVGGISGYYLNSSINDCYNIGNIILKDLKDQTCCGGVIGLGKPANLINCHNNCEITVGDLSEVENHIGLIIGYGSSGNEIKCSAINCSSMEYKNFRVFSEFDGNYDGLSLKTNESDMPDVLDILGDNFQMGKNNYPILNWQIEN